MKFRYEWVIPKDVVKSADKRVKIGKYKNGDIDIKCLV